MNGAKRVFDVTAAAVGMVFALPLLSAVALVIRLDGRGPVLFIQERIGLRGRPFRLYKFRTMVEEADSLGGPLTVGEDPRITRVGRFLRKYKLDEWPQLINVLKGEMSLVGPRPEVPKYVALYVADQRRVLDLVPGITDPASIKYRNESRLLEAAPDPERAYVEVVMPDKIRINLHYAARADAAKDIRTILKTLKRLSG